MDFIDDFIGEYRNNPCLWKADSTDFKNRTKRQEAYMKLIEVAAKHGEHYNIERTKQKINNLRCAFRQQLKKIIEAKKRGENDEVLYCPKRKYFESLMFLRDEENIERRAKRIDVTGLTTAEVDEGILEQESATESVIDTQLGKTNLNSINTTNRIETEPAAKSISHTDLIEEQTLEESFTEYCDEVYNKINDYIPSAKNTKDQKLDDIEKDTCFLSEKTTNGRKRSSSTSSLLSKEAEPANKQALKLVTHTLDLERLLSLTCENHNNMEDHYSNFGKIIAHKLRTMDASQAVYAEKIISDVLFHGQMKLLSVSSINQFINVNCSELSEKIRCNK